MLDLSNTAKIDMIFIYLHHFFAVFNKTKLSMTEGIRTTIIIYYNADCRQHFVVCFSVNDEEREALKRKLSTKMTRRTISSL